MIEVAVVAGPVTSGLRRAVLRPTWTPGTPMHGDTDPAAVHVGALDGALVVGACVLFRAPFPARPSDADAWQLRGMATADGRRGEGIGAAVLAGVFATLADRGARLVWCKARVTALPFYAGHGFAIDGDEFTEPETGLPHRIMWRSLAGCALVDG